MSNVSTCISDGERSKRTAFALLAARRQALIRAGRRALLAALLERGEATADDVRRAVPLPPSVGPKVFGAVPGELAEAGIIAADGYTTSNRPEAHARPVQRWRLVNRDAALTWLKDHPDQPTPPPEEDFSTDLFAQIVRPDAGTPGR